MSAQVFQANTVVSTTGGPFGVLADVVIDPLADDISHIVVQRDGDHHQPRLVPLWLLKSVDGSLQIQLDDAHVRQLQRVLPGEFIRTGGRKRSNELGEWRLRTALMLPYFRDDRLAPPEGQSSPPGVPRDQCEIRRKSSVLSCNDRLLGTVEGFLTTVAEADVFIDAVIVRSGLTGFRYDVAVPMADIAAVHGDMIALSIDRDAFRQRPTTTVLPVLDDQLSPAAAIAHRLGRLGNGSRDYLESFRSRRSRKL